MFSKLFGSIFSYNDHYNSEKEMIYHDVKVRTRSDSIYSEFNEEDYGSDDDDTGLIAASGPMSQSAAIKPVGAASFASYMNLTNTCIGAGCLALPYVVANCGLVLGIVLVLVSASMQMFSLHILSICAARVAADNVASGHPHPPSFYSVCQSSVPRLTFLVDLAVSVQSFGVCTSYLIVISDLMPDVLENFGVEQGFWQDRPVWVLLGFALCAPLSCFRKLDALRYTSGLSVMFVLFLMLMVLGFSLPHSVRDALHLHPCDGDGNTCVGDKPMISVTTKTFQVFGIITNAYSCQSNVFSVVHELRNATQARVDNITRSSIITALGVYGVIAIAGFCTYGSEVESNILVSYPTTHLVSVGRMFVSLLTAFSFPIVFQPGRNSVLGLWRYMDADETSWVTYRTFRYIAVTVAMLSGALLVSLLVDDLGIMFAFVGATGATMVSFILPGAAYYHMHVEEDIPFLQQDSLTIGAYCLLVAGCIFAPMGVAFLFIK